MPTLIRKFPTAKFAPPADAAGEGTRGPLPRWDFCSPHFPAPSLSLHQARASGCVIIYPQHRNERSAPQRTSTKKMWKVPVLFFVLGRASLGVLADASTVRPEDDMTTGVENSKAALGMEDYMMTPSASGEPHKSAGLTALMPTRAKSITEDHKEDRPTAESTAHSQGQSQSTTTPNVATRLAPGKTDGEKPTVKKGGLSTMTLTGIIVGVLLAIGFIGGIITVFVRKMSGRP
ncbi:podoplanin isoform X2 [Lagenorhynchus albirostris]|uniref:podoplanin isoform X2 n=1 Tax=Lagenorhynchus albirostris TaxID=27610 RepID=UPI0028E25DF9|nr:podoplanin isoform X2 [Lagenorhynchus albirostris]